MSTRTELLGEDGEWLLLLTVAGQTFRFATAPVAVFDGPDLLRFAEGMSELVSGLASAGSADSSIGVQVLAGESWDKIVANFAFIERSRCELRRWFEGQTLTQTRLVLSGFVSGFTYGEQDQPISFSVKRSVRTQSRTLPTSGMVVDDSTWPVRTAGGWVVDPQIIGSFYPVVLGFPGALGGAEMPAYEGLLVETAGAGNTDRVLIAGHRIVGTVVRLFNLTDDTAPVSALQPVLEIADKVGRTISYITVGNMPNPASLGDIYYVGHGLVDGGGIRNPKTGLVLRGAGDVLEWLLEVWTDVIVDAARFAAVKDRLNRYKIDTFVTEPTNPLDLVTKFVGFLPVTPRTGEDGLYFYLRPLDATAIDAVVHLDAGANEVDRVSFIGTTSDQVVNEVTVEYAPNRVSGRYHRRVTVSADDGARPDELDPSLTADERIIGSYRAKVSQGIYGRQPITITLDDVWDDATAVLVAQDIIAEQALPRRFVSYRGGPELEAYDPGTIVEISDSRVRLDRELALLLDLEVGGPTVVLHLELLDDPATLRRFVSS